MSIEPPEPCPRCGDDFQVGPSWNEDEGLVWYDWECGLEGPEAQTLQEAILLWNNFVRDTIKLRSTLSE